MSHRVIAGSAKGKPLKLVPGDSTRPVMDRVKEALFNILGPTVVDAAFLDLYGGTGAIGIEALSRGAAYTLFTEINRNAIRTIHDNLHSTNLDEFAEVRMIDVFELLKQDADEPFDIIYVAPPQYENLWLDTLHALEHNPTWYHDGSIIVVQIDPTEQENVFFEHLRGYDQRRYGNTLLWFFETRMQERDE